MNDAHAAVQIEDSGFPDHLTAPGEVLPKWPSPSTVISSLLSSFIVEITTAPHRETVFLTRAHQRVMDRALRRSVKIIA